MDYVFAELITTNIQQTMEVATARVYNWDVVQRRKEKVEGGDNKTEADAD